MEAHFKTELIFKPPDETVFGSARSLIIVLGYTRRLPFDIS